MLQIEDTVISSELWEEYFLCDLSVCKGMCCVEGDGGAPIADHEIDSLKSALPFVWSELSPEAQRVIDKQGIVYQDTDGEWVTSLVGAFGPCVFACRNESGCYLCAIEKVCQKQGMNVYKPMSCRLYPLRIIRYKSFRAVNYHRWDVCRAARLQGKQKGVRLYQALKEPLIAYFGSHWYEMLQVAVSTILPNR